MNPDCLYVQTDVKNAGEGKAKGSFREWAIRLVGGSYLWRACVSGPHGLGCTHRDAGPTGRWFRAVTERPTRTTQRWAGFQVGAGEVESAFDRRGAELAPDFDGPKLSARQAQGEDLRMGEYR